MGTGNRAAAELAELTAQLPRQVSARVVREYIRAVMIEPVVKRIYDIGVGVQTFDVPTMAGNVVNVPASPGTQLKALISLLQVGVPTQLGLVDDDGQSLPGAIVLGELELRDAQEQTFEGRFAQVARAIGNGEIPEQPRPDLIEPGLEVVEIDEGVAASGPAPDQPPPAIDDSLLTPEQRILAKRRARRLKANGNGNGAGNGR